MLKQAEESYSASHLQLQATQYEPSLREGIGASSFGIFNPKYHG
jgi:hypothetical protein